MLGQSSLSVVATVSDDYDDDDDGIDDNYFGVSVDNFSDDSKDTVSIAASTLGSANLVASQDQRYVYYGVASADVVYQHDLDTKGVVGSFAVGDDPNERSDQTAAVAFTPNGVTLAALNFSSNQLDLLADISLSRQTKYVSRNEEFTGLSLVNLSEMKTANVAITLLTDRGTAQTDTSNTTETSDDLVNPIVIQLAPNAQESVDVAQLFNLDITEANIGRLLIESDQPEVAGFSAVGKIRSDFFDAYLSSMVGLPLYSDYRESLHDFVIPEIPQDGSASVEFSIVNPNYNTSFYDVTHYASDGTVMKASNNQSLTGSFRETKSVSDFVSTKVAGQVIVAGGYDSGTTRNSAYLFISGTGTFSDTRGILTTPRYGHTATLLQNERILIAGGRNGTAILKNAEQYYPGEFYFLPTPGTMNVARYRHTATRLPSGMVLIAGGQNSRSLNNTAELYDPTEGTFTLLPAVMTSARDAHTATLLSNGKVLLAGGIDGIAVSASAEIFDPDTATFQAIAGMNAARVFHTAVSLPDGKVLIAGGYNGSYLNSAEIYDPATGLFAPTFPMIVERSHHTATLLSNGTVVIAGGRNASGPLDSGEIFDPVTGRFSIIESAMKASRYSHTATLLNDDADGVNDRILITGGFGANSADAEDDNDYEEQALDDGEFYNPANQQFTSAGGRMAHPSQAHTATLLTTGEQGYLRVESETGLLFSEIFDKGGAPASLSGIEVDKYVGINRIYSPRFTISSSFATQINIINGNKDSGATVTLTLHAADGSVLSSPVTYLLGRNAQLKGNLWDIFQNDVRLLNQTGWLEVASTVDRVVGSMTFTDANSTYLSSFELSGTPLSRFLYPLIAEDSTYQSQIALLNNGSQAANVELELWGLEGTLDGFVSISMPPGTSLAKTLSEIFPGMQAHRPGNVRVRSSQPLHSYGMLTRGSQGS